MFASPTRKEHAKDDSEQIALGQGMGRTLLLALPDWKLRSPTRKEHVKDDREQIALGQGKERTLLLALPGWKRKTLSK